MQLIDSLEKDHIIIIITHDPVFDQKSYKVLEIQKSEQ